MSRKINYRLSVIVSLLMLLVGCSKDISEYSDQEIKDHFGIYLKEMKAISPKSERYCNNVNANFLEFVLLDEITTLGNENYSSGLNKLLETKSVKILNDMSPSLQYIYYINRIEADLAPIVNKRIRGSAVYRDIVLFHQNFKLLSKSGTVSFARKNSTMLDDYFSSSICFLYILEYDLSNKNFENLSNVVARELLIEVQKSSIKLSGELYDEIKNLERNLN
ncbi:hypothetical protein [Shewanella glacialipiscicola]|uniref:hypothetical protein n=1 Tax=Shewanella glacialipiscicola TaxID=614069 RepID=UPI003D78C0B7